MENETVKNLKSLLKSLGEIKPDRDYARKSRSLILLSPRPVAAPAGIFDSFVYRLIRFGGLAVGAAVVLLILAAAVKTPMWIAGGSGLDNKSIEAEIGDLNIDVRLSEVKYYQESPKAVGMALKEVSLNGSAHLNGSVIKEETDRLDIQNPTNKEIDRLLNEAVL